MAKKNADDSGLLEIEVRPNQNMRYRWSCIPGTLDFTAAADLKQGEHATFYVRMVVVSSAYSLVVSSYAQAQVSLVLPRSPGCKTPP